MRLVSPFWGPAMLWTLLAAVVAVTIVARMRAGRRRAYRRASYEQWLQHRRSHGSGPGLHALDVRYTRREIGRADYVQRRADLLSAQPQPPLPDRTALTRVASG
ncbi:MAG TPA: hypothetical protein VMU65_00800 [Candidatus Saccharimonadales bacterium]|nr:hypothetical protein [Candidatus Saccharimonadales bacterium]